jgi:hypothetical protein
MVKQIADWIMYVCCAADVFVAALYATAGQPWKALYWLAAAVIVLSVTRMAG